MPPKKVTAAVAAAPKAAAVAISKKRKAPAAQEAPASERGKSSAAETAKAVAAKQPADTAINGIETKSVPGKRPAAAGTHAKKTTARSAKQHAVINKAPTQILDIYVFGEGGNGELGLGAAKGSTNVKRPRLNPFLTAGQVGIVQVAVGGMHVAALSHDNRIYTWGVNDQGACGRDTNWEGGLKDMDENSSDEDSEDEASALNPKEATPTAIDETAFPKGTKFVQLAAGDSMTFALTDAGFVYGWGTFRSNEGILGFTKDINIQHTPMLIPELKNITSLACGANHVLALDINGNVFAWGSGQQNQLGRRVVERTRLAGLTPREFGLPRKKITNVACGAYHSFAIDTSDNVWAWGLNSYGECGIFDNAGQDEAVVPNPQKVKSLAGHKMKVLKGAAHHSLGVTEDGQCLVWGRADGAQVGLKVSSLPHDDLIYDERQRPRILKKPTRIPGLNAAFATCESDHSIAIGTDGRAWSWGFSATYQTGQGTDDDIEVATVIDNTAVRGKKLVWAGAGGQFSALAGIAGEQKPMSNGV